MSLYTSNSRSIRSKILKKLIPSTNWKSIIFCQNIYKVTFDTFIFMWNLEILILRFNPPGTNKDFFNPSIKNLLISKNDRKAIHSSIFLEGWPINLCIDQTFKGVFWSMYQNVRKSIMHSFGHDIQSLIFDKKVEGIPIFFSDWCPLKMRNGSLNFPSHPLFSELKTCFEFSIFTNEFFFCHEGIISQYLMKCNDEIQCFSVSLI